MQHMSHNQFSKEQYELSLKYILNIMEVANAKQSPTLPKIMSLTDDSGQKLIHKETVDISIR